MNMIPISPTMDEEVLKKLDEELRRVIEAADDSDDDYDDLPELPDDDETVVIMG